jgi:hypothetical protein
MIRCSMRKLILLSLWIAGSVQLVQAEGIRANLIQAASLHLAHLLADERETADGTLRYREAAAIEVLLYRSSLIRDAALSNQPYEFSFSSLRKIQYDPTSRILRYRAPMIQVDVGIREASIESLVYRRNPVGKFIPAEKGSISHDEINDASLGEWEKTLSALARRSRGFQDHVFGNPQTALDHSKNDQNAPAASHRAPSETFLDIREKWVREGEFDQTPWTFAPVKLVSWPIQKLMYDLPAMVTSVATESVTRSPWHNLQGAWDEFRGSMKLGKNAFIDLFAGIVHPRTARAVDGTLELLDASLKLGNSVAGIVKSGVSTIAYPIYRAAGGKKSQRVALRGKRAVIVLIDSALGSDLSSGIIDTYGEEIVRSKLKSISDYYCVSSTVQKADIEKCIREIPDRIQYLDIVSLQHSGGVTQAERYMKLAVETKKVKPELLLSIGCYDLPSAFVDPENTMGQERSSWAVHYYLANMLEKRLRGSTAMDAASEAYGESFVTNAANPVSWGAVLLIGTSMEDELKNGYFGSRPSLLTPNSVVRKTIIDAENDWYSYQWDVARRIQLREFHQKVDRLLAEGKIRLKPRTLRMLEESKRKLASISR